MRSSHFVILNLNIRECFVHFHRICEPRPIVMDPILLFRNWVRWNLKCLIIIKERDRRTIHIVPRLPPELHVRLKWELLIEQRHWLRHAFHDLGHLFFQKLSMIFCLRRRWKRIIQVEKVNRLHLRALLLGLALIRLRSLGRATLTLAVHWYWIVILLLAWSWISVWQRLDASDWRLKDGLRFGQKLFGIHYFLREIAINFCFGLIYWDLSVVL